jgi:hypothetical protein
MHGSILASRRSILAVPLSILIKSIMDISSITMARITVEKWGMVESTVMQYQSRPGSKVKEKEGKES